MSSRRAGGFLRFAAGAVLAYVLAGATLVAAMLDKILEYIKGHPSVWVPRHDELAHWVNEHEIDEIPYLDRFPL